MGIKVKILAIIFLLGFNLFAYLPQTALAANCSFTYNPSPPNQNMDKLQVTMTSPDFSADSKFTVVFFRNDTPADKFKPLDMKSDLPFNLQDGLTIEFSKPITGGWKKGKYKIPFLKQEGGRSIDNPDCAAEFTLEDISSQPNCKVSIPTTSIKPSTDVTLHVEGIKESNIDGLDTGTNGYDINVNKKFNQVYETKNGKDINLGKFDAKTYLVEIRTRCGFLGTGCSSRPARIVCTTAFNVTPEDGAGGGEIPVDQVSKETCKKKGDPSINPATDTICTESGVEGLGCDIDPDTPGIQTDPNKPGFKTAIGCIHTNPGDLIQDVLKFAIGIGGGLAFLMMLLGAFQMLTSAGNPETLAAGKDRLTSAVIGLLFIIFAVLLLQIIGVDILGILKR